MSEFIKKCFFIAMMFFGCNALSVNPLKCVFNDAYAKLCVLNVTKNINAKNNETRHIKWHETCKCKGRLYVSLIINKGGIKTNADVNAKNWLIRVVVIKDLFGIQEIVNVNVINQVMLEI